MARDAGELERAGFGGTVTKRAATLVGALLLSGVLAGCQAEDARVCTENIEIEGVTAVDVNGAPVDGLVISDTVAQSHVGFVVDQFLTHAPGNYVIFGDPWRQQIGNSRGVVRVTGSNGTLRFGANFEFDASGCHTRRVSGPDTVVAR